MEKQDNPNLCYEIKKLKGLKNSNNVTQITGNSKWSFVDHLPIRKEPISYIQLYLQRYEKFI